MNNSYSSLNKSFNSFFVQNGIAWLPVKLILILLTVSLNFLILIVIIFKIKRKKYSYYLFFSISLCDLIVGLSSMSFMTVFTYFLYWPLGYSLCVFWIIIDYSTSTISLFVILLQTIQRFTLVKFYTASKEKFTWRKRVTILSVWIVSYTYWTVSVLIITSSSNFDYFNCYFTYKFEYVLTTNLIAYGLPIFFTALVSVMTLYKLIQKRKRETRSSIPHNTTIKIKKINKKERAFLCVLTVSLNLVAFWSLFVITWPINAYCNGCLESSLMELSYWLAYIASTTNPIILLTFNYTIRKKLIRLMCCMCFLRSNITTNENNQETMPNHEFILN